MTPGKILRTFTNAVDGFRVEVQEHGHCHATRYTVTMVDIDTGRMVPCVLTYNNLPDAIEAAQVICGADTVDQDVS